jgi:hypothetical protein
LDKAGFTQKPAAFNPFRRGWKIGNEISEIALSGQIVAALQGKLGSRE